MADGAVKYIWRCSKCSNHFANIHNSDGVVKQEKKCPKCKTLNILTLTPKEIFIQCKFFDPGANGYREDYEDIYPFPD